MALPVPQFHRSKEVFGSIYSNYAGSRLYEVLIVRIILFLIRFGSPLAMIACPFRFHAREYMYLPSFTQQPLDLKCGEMTINEVGSGIWVISQVNTAHELGDRIEIASLAGDCGNARSVV